MSELVTVGHGSRGQWRTQSVTLSVAALFSVTCPVCQAGPSQRCLSPTAGRVSPAKSHKARADAAVAARAGGR